MAENSPFASFQPSTEAPAAPVKAKKERKKKAAAPKAEKAPAAAPAPAKPKKERKVRAAKKPRPMKVDPLVIFGACVGLGLEDVSAVAKLMQSLQEFPKKARSRIIVALAKIFA